MSDLLNTTSKAIKIITKKESDYYSLYFNNIKNDNSKAYSCNALAHNLLHIDFRRYLIDEIIYILDCGIRWLKHTISLFEDKNNHSKKEINNLDYAMIQFIDIYSNNLLGFCGEVEYEYIQELRKYLAIDNDLVRKYLNDNYKKSEFIKLLYIYILVCNKERGQARMIYKTYRKVNKNHPYYLLSLKLENKIKEVI